MKQISDRSFFRSSQWQTMRNVRRLGSSIYLLDYQHDYDIDDLLRRGTDSTADLLLYASRHLTGGLFRFRSNGLRGGCSTFNAYTPAGEQLLARNFDYKAAPCFVIWTHPANGYASIGVSDANFMLYGRVTKPSTMLNRLQILWAPYTCVDGINEKGLSIAVLQIHAAPTNQNTGKISLTTTALVRAVLDKAVNIEEALNIFRSYDLHDPMGVCYHYQLCDADGNSVLVEYVRNEMRVIRPGAPEYALWMADFCGEKPVQFAANFYLSTDADHSGDDGNHESHQGGNRAARVSERLKAAKGILTEREAMAVLDNIHLDYQHKKYPWRIISLWSGVYNTSRRTLTFAANMDYSTLYRFDLDRPGVAVRLR